MIKNMHWIFLLAKCLADTEPEALVANGKMLINIASISVFGR
jgi:hypothetical protein